MNKNSIKKTVSMALALSLTSTVIPSILNFGTTAVYAASSSGYITDVKLETNKDKTEYVYTKSSCNSDYKLSKIDGKAPTSLYAKVGSNVSKIKVTDIDLGNDCDKVKIYKGDTEVSEDEDVKISSSLTLKLKAYKGSDLKETYTLKIAKEDGNDNNNDDIYLDDLSLSYDGDDINFDFDKKKSSYDINVKNKVSSVKVQAKPEDSDYTVKINGNKVDDDSDDWTDKVSLSEGANAITVKIKDDDSNDREYTLNINRESSGTSSSSGTIISTSDLNTSLSEGWQLIGENWYFIGPDGSKQTGWQKIDGRWYYMNETGAMQVGWMKNNSNGKSYYLNPTSNGFKGSLVQIK